MSQTRQIALGPALAGAAALVLLVSLFLDWYEPGVSAWTVFEVLDLLLAALALAALALVAQALGLGMPGLRLPAGALLGVAAVALVIVVSQLINHPPLTGRGNEAGIWLALGAAVVLAAGAALGSSYVSVVRVGDPEDSASAGSARARAGAETAGAPPARPPRPPVGQDPSTQPLPRSEPERPA
ncbi:MAG: hypothetical protein M3350_08185 [Actinomycetota bacterium]|nr:hypothetical protein [Actinomycetota bacterium]